MKKSFKIDSKEFGKRLERMRRAHLLTQKDIADYVSITNGALSAIERGQADPSLERVIGIKEFFDLKCNDVKSLDYWVFGTEQVHDDYPNEVKSRKKSAPAIPDGDLAKELQVMKRENEFKDLRIKDLEKIVTLLEKTAP